MLLWRTVAGLALLLGVLGVFLPVLPTVPFVLLAAWAASKGWPQLEARMLAHPVYGPYIVRWRERGAVPRKAKWFATLGMSASVLWIGLSGAPLGVKIGVPLLLMAVGAWLWRRPEQ
jgi:uncharacterized membrane protein YbaN (DUF454 family)